VGVLVLVVKLGLFDRVRALEVGLALRERGQAMRSGPFSPLAGRRLG
jgi:hypothetical protein